VITNEQRAVDVIALVGGEIIDGNGGFPIKNGVIVIEGKRISTVGDRSTPVPLHAKKIPLDGKFIIPGLIGYVGLIADLGYVDTLVRYEGRYDELALETAQIALRSGFTTIDDSNSPRDDVIKVRNAIHEGRAVGSRIHTAAGWIGASGPYGVGATGAREALGPSLLASINSRWECNVGPPLWSMSLAQVREEVRKYIDTGVNWLNVMVGGNYGSEHWLRFSPRVLRAIVEEGHRAGLVVKANCMYSEEIALLALDIGFDLVYIAGNYPSPISAELIDQLVKRQSTLWFRPDSRQELQALTRLVTEFSDEFSRTNQTLAEWKPRNERALLRAGVPMALALGGCMLSADTRNHPRRKVLWEDLNVIGKDHINAMKAAVEIGMKPMEILQAGTRVPARAHKLDKDLGTLEQGKFADLLVLNRNPLENPDNYNSIHMVMKEGQVIDRDALPTQRLLSREYPKHLLDLAG
jgi:imidazolonepropionase-like amidohydrolase